MGCGIKIEVFEIIAALYTFGNVHFSHKAAICRKHILVHPSPTHPDKKEAGCGYHAKLPTTHFPIIHSNLSCSLSWVKSDKINHYDGYKYG